MCVTCVELTRWSLLSDARSADRSLSAVHASLCARLPAFPELARLVPDAAPRELLPIFHPQRSLKMYRNLRPLGTSNIYIYVFIYI